MYIEVACVCVCIYIYNVYDIYFRCLFYSVHVPHLLHSIMLVTFKTMQMQRDIHNPPALCRKILTFTITPMLRILEDGQLKFPSSSGSSILGSKLGASMRKNDLFQTLQPLQMIKTLFPWLFICQRYMRCYHIQYMARKNYNMGIRMGHRPNLQQRSLPIPTV